MSSTCKQCKNPVSFFAQICSHCSQKSPSMRWYHSAMSAVSFLFLLCFFLSSNSPHKPVVALQEKSHPEIQFGKTNKIIKASYGCIQKDTLENLETFRSEDKAAFENALTEDIIEQQCTLFKVGDDVFADDVSFTGLVKIRRPGKTVSYWTIVESIKGQLIH